MKIAECVAVMKSMNIDAMVWEINNCPIDELRTIYGRNGFESHVILTRPDIQYMAENFRDSRYNERSGDDDIGPSPTMLMLDNEYYCYIIHSFEETTDTW